MLTSDERREVAEKFRRDAAVGDKLKAKGLGMTIDLTDAPSYLQDIAMFIGVRGDTVEWTWFERRFADLIDPTCHGIEEREFDGIGAPPRYTSRCSNCGQLWDETDGIPRFPAYCPDCGCRVVKNDGR